MTTPSHRATLLTPPGAGAIALIRLTGPDPIAILEDHFVHTAARQPQSDGRLLYGRLMDGQNVIDDVLVSIEPVSNGLRAVEISCHGGVRVVERILAILERKGVVVDADRPAALSCWPAHNRIEEEAIEALAASRTLRAAGYAAALRVELPGKIAATCANLDCTRSLEALSDLARSYPSASALLNGISVTLAGPPNSGKSTLFNTLLGRGAVITSPVPGTTRDWVRESIEWDGVPVDLVDTAGHRATRCELEQLAIEAGTSRMHAADAAFLVFDGSLPLTQADHELMHAVGPNRFWVVANKADLGICWGPSDIARVENACGSPPVQLSARTGEGCELLKKNILDRFQLSTPQSPPIGLFTSRQVTLVKEQESRPSPSKEFLNKLLGIELADETGRAL